jgi:peptidoglycan LD-endopeptidase CwlK
VIDPSKVVTEAPPGHSWHEFGMAVDLVPRSLIGIRGWQPTSPLWRIISDLATKRGLTSGSCWHHKDLPHVQLTGKFGVSPRDDVRKLYLANGGRLDLIWNASGIAEDVERAQQQINV